MSKKGGAHKAHGGPSTDASEGTTDRSQDLNSVLVASGADLFSALAWPALALVVLLVWRRHLVSILVALSQKISKEGTSVALGPFSLTAEQGDPEALRSAMGALRSMVERSLTADDTASISSLHANSALQELDAIADKYARLHHQSLPHRIALLNHLGQEMAAIAMKAKWKHADLAGHKKDGFVVALAFIVLIDPRQEDVMLMCDAVRTVKRNHARYMIAMALGSLAAIGFVAPTDRNIVLASLDSLMRAGDPSLNRRIVKSREILNVNASPGASPALAAGEPAAPISSAVDSGSLSWRGRLEHEIQRWAGDASSLAYARANAAAIGETISGKKPDSNRIAPEIGAHAVANIPAVHVPSFVQLSIDGDPKPYKNGYDLGTYHLGEPAPGEALRTRVLVDQALPVGPPESIYFCAVELNGQGIRFFGDICLVLKPGSLSNPEVLERNSYDVTRAPVAAEIDAYPLGQDRDDARAEQLGRWAGSWDRDLGAITARKVLQNWGGTVRRMTTGQISRELLDDEDYIEVLKVGSFGASDVQEARVSAADAALDASVGDRLRRGPTPAFQSLLWRHYRRKAEKALRTVGIRTHVVTTLGRTR